jgi:hypothetical protein
MFPEAATKLLNPSGVPLWRKEFQQKEDSSTSDVFKSPVRGKTFIISYEKDTANMLSLRYRKLPSNLKQKHGTVSGATLPSTYSMAD